MSTEADLLAEIAAYCVRARIAETTFGRMAVNDGKFVARIRSGGGLTMATYQKVRTFMAAPIGESPKAEVAA